MTDPTPAGADHAAGLPPDLPLWPAPPAAPPAAPAAGRASVPVQAVPVDPPRLDPVPAAPAAAAQQPTPPAAGGPAPNGTPDPAVPVWGPAPVGQPPAAPGWDRPNTGYAPGPHAPGPADDPALDDGTAAPPAGLWDRMRADPQYAPEHLALEAVSRLGPEARRWVERVHLQQPGLHPDVVAQKAAKKFINLARLSGAVSGAAGLPGAVVDVGVLAWTQARMVLHIAAAYGIDPAHPDRATDLLVLQKVHKVAETARLALGVAAGRERAGTLFRTGTKTPVGQVALKLGLKLAQMAGVKAVKKMFAKMVPGAAIILGTWANSSATTDLARRTQALYRQPAALGYLPDPRKP